MSIKLRTIGRKLQPTRNYKVARAPKIADQELLTPKHREWRLIVCRRAGWQCQWVENGVRCPKRAPEHRMIGDHIVERQDGGALDDPANGQCLCVAHNTIKGVAARAARIGKGQGG